LVNYFATFLTLTNNSVYCSDAKWSFCCIHRLHP